MKFIIAGIHYLSFSWMDGANVAVDTEVRQRARKLALVPQVRQRAK